MPVVWQDLGVFQHILSELVTEVREELQDLPTDENSRIWTDEELKAYLNDGNLLCQQLTEWLEDLQDLTPIEDVRDYPLPHNVMHLKRVSFDREYLPQTTVYDLDHDRGNWRDAIPDDPIRYFIDKWDTLSGYPTPKADGILYGFTSEFGLTCAIDDWTFDGEFGIILAIDDSEAGSFLFRGDTDDHVEIGSEELGVVCSVQTDEENFGLIYTALPAELRTDFDVPQLPGFVQPALVSFACFRAYSREGHEKNPQLAGLYYQDFGDWMQQVLVLRGRQWPERIVSMEPAAGWYERRLTELNPPTNRVEFKAHYQ